MFSVCGLRLGTSYIRWSDVNSKNVSRNIHSFLSRTSSVYECDYLKQTISWNPTFCRCHSNSFQFHHLHHLLLLLLSYLLLINILSYPPLYYLVIQILGYFVCLMTAFVVCLLCMYIYIYIIYDRLINYQMNRDDLE